MPKASQAKAAIPYIERLLEDAFVQEQVRSAVGGLRAAYSRARKQRTQVVEDKGLYRNLRQAATALQRATRALQPPEPEPKHRGRKFAAVALAIGATAFVTMKLQKEYSQQRENSAVVASAVDTASAPGGPRPESPAPEHTPAVNAAEGPDRVSAPGS